jgi:hypothetical protein
VKFLNRTFWHQKTEETPQRVQAKEGVAVMDHKEERVSVMVVKNHRSHAATEFVLEIRSKISKAKLAENHEQDAIPGRPHGKARRPFDFSHGPW